MGQSRSDPRVELLECDSVRVGPDLREGLHQDRLAHGFVLGPQGDDLAIHNVDFLGHGVAFVPVHAWKYTLPPGICFPGKWRRESRGGPGRVNESPAEIGPSARDQDQKGA